MNEPTLFDAPATATPNTLGGWRATDPSTSRRAALDNYPRNGSQKAKVLIALLPGDATTDEVDRKLGYAPGAMAHRRMPELEKLALVRPTGDERDTSYGSKARVFTLTDAGAALARQYQAAAQR